MLQIFLENFSKMRSLRDERKVTECSRLSLLADSVQISHAHRRATCRLPIRRFNCYDLQHHLRTISEVSMMRSMSPKSAHYGSSSTVILPVESLISLVESIRTSDSEREISSLQENYFLNLEILVILFFLLNSLNIL